MLRPLFVAFLLVASAASPGRLHAQGAVEDDAARSLFRLGEVAYFEGRFEESLRHFQQAYDLSHRAQLLYNIGQAADRAGDRRRALTAFESFLAEVPVNPNRAFVVSRIDVLRREVAAEDAAAERARATVASPEVAPPPPEPSEPDGASVAPERSESSQGSRGRSVVGWTTASVGLVSLALGATFLPLGLIDHAAVEGASDGETWAELRDSYDRSSPRIVAGTVLLGVGAAAAAVGFTLALRSSSSDEAPVDLHVSGNGLAIRGRF